MTSLFLAITPDELASSLDTVWMLLAAMLVFFMQPGFALCEAGFTRSKNTANILFKNFVDFVLGSLLAHKQHTHLRIINHKLYLRLAARRAAN